MSMIYLINHFYNQLLIGLMYRFKILQILLLIVNIRLIINMMYMMLLLIQAQLSIKPQYFNTIIENHF